MGYFTDKAVFGRDAAIAILAGRFLAGFFGLVILMILGVVGVCSSIYHEIALELRYQHHYGTAWKAEYEHYHGSLSQAHTQVAVASLCMVALVVVLGWVCRRLLHKHQHGRRANDV